MSWFKNKFRSLDYLKLLSSESGLALVQVLSLGAILTGAIGLSVWQNSKTSKKVAHDIYAQDLKQFVDRVQSVLANQPDCTDMISATTGFSTLATNGTISPTSLEGTTLGLFLEETDVGTSTPRYGSQEKISLTDITIERTTDTAATLTLKFNIDEDVLGIREFSKAIPLVIIGTPTTVTSCHANPDNIIEDAVKRFCHGPGAIYNPDTHQCFIIGLDNEPCDNGEYVKGLSYSAATKMVTPVCDVIAGLTYDTTGCLARAGVPTGFDASGDLVCTNMDENYVWEITYANQKNQVYENCITRRTKLSAGAEGIRVRCVQPTSTPTHTATPTNTPAGATNTPTETPTPTATPATPTATPTSCGGGEVLSPLTVLDAVPFGVPQTVDNDSAAGGVYACSNTTGTDQCSVEFNSEYQKYAFEPVQTGVTSGYYSVDTYNTANAIEAHPASFNVTYTGGYANPSTCSCTLRLYSSVDEYFGIEELLHNKGDDGSWSGGIVAGERISTYTVTNCALPGPCVATRTDTLDCSSGGQNVTLTRDLVGGIHRGDKNNSQGNDFDVCIDPNAESRFIFTSIKYSSLYTRKNQDIIVCAATYSNTTCTCSVGSITNGHFKPTANPQQLLPRRILQIEWNYVP